MACVIVNMMAIHTVPSTTILQAAAASAAQAQHSISTDIGVAATGRRLHWMFQPWL